MIMPNTFSKPLMVIIRYNQKKYKESLGKKTEMLLASCINDNRNTELEDGNEGEKFVCRDSLTEKLGYMIICFHLRHTQNVFGVRSHAANSGSSIPEIAIYSDE